MSDDATVHQPSPWSVGAAVPAVVTPAPSSRPLTAPVSDAAALRLLLVAATGGLLAQAVFVDQGLGLNVGLWSAFVLGAAWLFRRRDVAIDRLDLWLPAAALAFGAFVAIRGDGVLLLLNTLASWGLLLVSVAALRGVPVTGGSWGALARVGTAVSVVVLGGAARLGGGLRPMRLGLARQSMAMRVVGGLLLAVPLVIVFTALFAAADAVFATQLDRLLVVDFALDDVVARVLFGLVAGWLLAGVLLIAWLAEDRVTARPAGEVRRRLGVIEGVIALVAVDAVFAVFVLLQAAYLFGGLDTLAASGMTYSEYARRGFFELVTVAGLAGLLLLAMDALIAHRTLAFRAAAMALALMTGVVLASALARLALYQQAYGWTELRFYVLLAIAWLGVGVAAAVGGLLLDRLRLAPRVLVLAAVVLAIAANVVGPQRFVTEQNLARAIDPSLVPADGWSGLDVDYLSYLGNEAVPPLVGALPQLPPEVRANVELDLRHHARRLRLEDGRLGWASFNLARARALEYLSAAGY